MVTIGMNYVVLEGKEEVFEKAFAHVLTRLEGADGHESSRLLRDVQKGAVLCDPFAMVGREKFQGVRGIGRIRQGHQLGKGINPGRAA